MKNYDAALSYLEKKQPFSSIELREEALLELKKQGLTISESIKAFRNAGKVSLGQAKDWVSSSAAWADMRASAQPLHCEARRVLGLYP
jgi:hypothetical protein